MSGWIRWQMQILFTDKCYMKIIRKYLTGLRSFNKEEINFPMDYWLIVGFAHTYFPAALKSRVCVWKPSFLGNKLQAFIMIFFSFYPKEAFCPPNFRCNKRISSTFLRSDYVLFQHDQVYFLYIFSLEAY